MPVKRGRWFCTRYQSGDSTFGTTLFARSIAEAKRLIRRRGLGESLERHGGWSKKADFTPPSRLLWANAQPGVVLHALTFLCHLGVRARAIDPRDLLSDTGLLHEAQHYFLFGGDPPTILKVDGRTIKYKSALSKRALYERMRQLEAAIPGYTERP